MLVRRSVKDDLGALCSKDLTQPVEIGGELSHGSIILRELGVPAVTNVGEIGAAIRDGDEVELAAIGGPCIAGELAARRPSCVVFASSEKKRSEWFASLFRTPYYHMWPSAELFSLEISAALKNAYTLAVAIAAGFLQRPESADAAGAQMHNPAAAAFGQGVSEMGYILEGELELILDDIVYHLHENDSFHFNSSRRHAYRNPGTTRTRVLWANTPPTF